MKLHIKNMVSTCCKRVVKLELKKLGLYYINVQLGEVEIKQRITDAQREQLRTSLHRFGMDLLDDKRAIIVERIKNAVVEMVYHPGTSPKLSFSAYIVRKLHHLYHYPFLSKLFSEVMGITIEQYFIAHKVERAKELIFYDEHNLTEISFMLNYSSVAHLSNQFKKVTGMAPSQFKKLDIKHRIGFDEM